MSEWISVKDKMPENYNDVLIWPRPDFGVEQFVGHFNPCAKGSAYGNTGMPGWFAAEHEHNSGVHLVKVAVTHWMPLPEPPKNG